MMGLKFVLVRNIILDPEILGNLFIFKGTDVIFNCKTLELGWKDNQKGISCAPRGEYPIVFEYSPKFNRKLWELKGVPQRSEIKIHVANYYRQLRGCIAVGSAFKDLNYDEYPDLTNSADTLNKIHEIMKDVEETTILIC